MAGKNSDGGGASRKNARREPSLTGLLECAAQQGFCYCPNNASSAAEQTGLGGGRFLTSAQDFANQVLVGAPKQFHIRDVAAKIGWPVRAQ